jgi:hypothetical protein
MSASFLGHSPERMAVSTRPGQFQWPSELSLVVSLSKADKRGHGNRRTDDNRKDLLGHPDFLRLLGF